MAGGIRDRDDDDLDEQHEINITPFIDVMLVLLIIFMVAAPLSTVDIAVQLPAASVKPQPRPEKPVYISIKANLDVAVGEDSVSRACARRDGRARHQGQSRSQTVPARRQDGALRRTDHRPRSAAWRRISESRARRGGSDKAGGVE